jgi:hypothetical protein
MNGKHPTNPNISLEVWRSDECEMAMITDMVKRIIESDRENKNVSLVMCNPCPTYRKVAYMLQQLNVNMRNVKFYMMDEWADEDGNAPAIMDAEGKNFYAVWEAVEQDVTVEYYYMDTDGNYPQAADKTETVTFKTEETATAAKPFCARPFFTRSAMIS